VWAVTDTSQTAIVIYAGPGVGENIVGDSACHVLAGCVASGSGGNDYLDLGTDGGGFVVGDNNSDTGSEVGAGNDVIIGGSADEFLIGDNSRVSDSQLRAQATM